MKGKNKLYTTPQAATMLGLSATQIRTMIGRGQAKPDQQIGGTWVFTIEEIERLRTSRRPPGRPFKQK